MDEDFRKAQRMFQRNFGGDELGILALYYQQIRDYLQQQKLGLVFGGVGRDIWHLKTLYPEMTPCRNMTSRHIHFLHYADLDARTPEEILKECCCHASWADWFDLVAYYQAMVSKQPGSSLWYQVLSAPSDTPALMAQDGTTYQQRLQASFDEWNNFSVVCLLEPKYVAKDDKKELWANWTVQLLLVGYGEKNDTSGKTSSD